MRAQRYAYGCTGAGRSRRHALCRDCFMRKKMGGLVHRTVGCRVSARKNGAARPLLRVS